jgi:hypothetical protein
MGAFTIPEVINLLLQTADEWELWHYPDFRALKDIAKFLQAIHGAKLASQLLDPDTNGIYMGEIRKMTYRTPDYMLSSALDFRPGEKGYQQHIWQATLSPYAVVFVNNPDSMREGDSHRPSYWMANGRQPRVLQADNVLIALYDIPRYPSAPPPLEARHYALTHAYFPTWAFDEVVEQDGWVFGRAGDGYVALYSHQPYEWITEGPDADQEIAAPGRKNVWICQMGRASIDGSFEEFIASILGAELKIKGLDVTYHTPGIGVIEFNWDDPMKIDGRIFSPWSLSFNRWDNPYTEAAFGSRVFEIEFQGMKLTLDFEKGTRVVE